MDITFVMTCYNYLSSGKNICKRNKYRESHFVQVHYLHKHLHGENYCENVIGSGKKHAFRAVRRDVGAFHCQSDAIQGDEKQNHIVKPFLIYQFSAHYSEPVINKCNKLSKMYIHLNVVLNIYANECSQNIQKEVLNTKVGLQQNTK